MDSYDYILVGSGINSLVCAALLARKGKSVCVLERNDRLGGCIRTDELTEPGFLHDTLSTSYPLFITSPGYAELKDDLERHGLVFCNTGSPTAVVLPDGRSHILKCSREDNVANFDAMVPGNGKCYQKMMAEFEDTLELTFALLGSRLWSWSLVKSLLKHAWRLGPTGLADYFGWGLKDFRSWAKTSVRSDIVSSLFAPWIGHVGMTPEQPASAQMACVMAYCYESVGIPIVKGGGYQLVEAFQGVIEEYGGEFKLDVDVDEILVDGNKAVGVLTSSGVRMLARSNVVVNVTPTQLYSRLLRNAPIPENILEQAKAFRYGRTDMQIHIAMDKPPKWSDPNLATVSLVHISSGMDAVSRAHNQAERGVLPSEPAVLAISQSTALDPSRAPQGKAVLWIQVMGLPREIQGDAEIEISPPADGKWNESIREQFADRIIELAAQHITNLKTDMLKRTVLSPADLEAMNINLVGGDPLAGATALDQLFIWRPLRALKNHDTPIKGLYHIGASTHPGAGLGGGSGYLVANSI